MQFMGQIWGVVVDGRFDKSKLNKEERNCDKDRFRIFGEFLSKIGPKYDSQIRRLHSYLMLQEVSAMSSALGQPSDISGYYSRGDDVIQ